MNARVVCASAPRAARASDGKTKRHTRDAVALGGSPSVHVTIRRAALAGACQNRTESLRIWLGRERAAAGHCAKVSPEKQGQRRSGRWGWTWAAIGRSAVGRCRSPSSLKKYTRLRDPWVAAAAGYGPCGSSANSLARRDGAQMLPFHPSQPHTHSRMSAATLMLPRRAYTLYPTHSPLPAPCCIRSATSQVARTSSRAAVPTTCLCTVLAARHTAYDTDAVRALGLVSVWLRDQQSRACVLECAPCAPGSSGADALPQEGRGPGRCVLG